MEKFSTELVIKGKEYFDPILYHNLQEIINLVDLKFDGVILIDGMEGSGKSELGKQCCLIMNNSFGDYDVFYTNDQFNEWIERAQPGTCGLWDEFVLAGLSTEALTKLQNTLIKKFTMMRKKRLIVILVIPYIFLLRKYFAVARTRCLIHVFCEGHERGYFKFYNYQEKQWIYNYGYKTWLYSPKLSPSFKGSFKAWSEKYIDENAIEKKKDNAMKLEQEEKVVLTKREMEVLLQNKKHIRSCTSYDGNRSDYEALLQLYNRIEKYYIPQSDKSITYNP